MYLLAVLTLQKIGARNCMTGVLIEPPDPRTGVHTFVLNLRYHEEADYLRPFA